MTINATAEPSKVGDGGIVQFSSTAGEALTEEPTQGPGDNDPQNVQEQPVDAGSGVAKAVSSYGWVFGAALTAVVGTWHLA